MTSGYYAYKGTYQYKQINNILVFVSNVKITVIYAKCI